MEGRPTEPDQPYLFEWLAPRQNHPPIENTQKIGSFAQGAYTRKNLPIPKKF